jgi:hypothetical protein
LGFAEQLSQNDVKVGVHVFFHFFAKLSEGDQGVFGNAGPERLNQFEEFGHDGWEVEANGGVHLGVVLEHPPQQVEALELGVPVAGLLKVRENCAEGIVRVGQRGELGARGVLGGLIVDGVSGS